MHRSQVVAREERWRMATVLATFGAVALLLASVIIGSSLGGGGEADSLRDLHDHASTVTLVSVIQALGFLLLAMPLLYLFRAVRERSPRVRAQFLPLVMLAPIVLSAAAVLNGVAANDAATAFVNGKGTSSLTRADATKECGAEQRDDANAFRDDFGTGSGAISDCATTQIENDRAEDAIKGTAIRKVAELIQLVGLLALAFAFIYCCLNGMRAGLLTRFWGALGIAIGAASIFGLYQLGIIWFIYFGLLVAGWLPGGRPPAWAAGESIPWPSPGERAAAELEAPGEDEGDDESSEGANGSAPPPSASSESESR
jgi:ABC-type multidrug transport system fused ATPase/permease subunit